MHKNTFGLFLQILKLKRLQYNIETVKGIVASTESTHVDNISRGKLKIELNDPVKRHLYILPENQKKYISTRAVITKINYFVTKICRYKSTKC